MQTRPIQCLCRTLHGSQVATGRRCGIGHVEAKHDTFLTQPLHYWAPVTLLQCKNKARYLSRMTFGPASPAVRPAWQTRDRERSSTFFFFGLVDGFKRDMVASVRAYSLHELHGCGLDIVGQTLHSRSTPRSRRNRLCPRCAPAVCHGLGAYPGRTNPCIRRTLSR